MGAYACRAVSTAAEADQILVADRDLAGARRVAAELGSKAAPLELDIGDAELLRRALADVDIVLNTAGPFYRLGRPVLEAAIATGTNYLDICDDWEPTLEMLALDDDARRAGVTAVIGMGASPGTSNLLAVLAMNECDTAERVFTGWRAGAGVPRPTPENPEPEATAAVEHWIHNCAEPIKVWRGGRMTDAEAMEELTLRYPGREADPVWTCGHPEPLTLPRIRPEIQEALNVMTSRRGLMDAVSRIAIRVRSQELDVATGSKKLLVEPDMWGSAAGPAPNSPDLFAVVEGLKDDVPVRVGARPLAIPEATMGESTGYPLAVATVMMVRGQVDKPGVHGPEGAIDARTYFRDLAALAPGCPADGEIVEIASEENDQPRR